MNRESGFSDLLPLDGLHLRYRLIIIASVLMIYCLLFAHVSNNILYISFQLTWIGMKGTHGTSRSKANNIVANGFHASPVGIRGSGVYFWGYLSDSMEEISRNLAKAWWSDATRRQSYSQDSDKSCSVVFAAFDVSNDLHFDFEAQEVRESFIRYSDKMIDRIEGDDDEKASTLYDMFVQRIETKSQKQYKLIHFKVHPPRGFVFPILRDIIGQPSCYAVKDISCITILDHEEIDDE